MGFSLEKEQNLIRCTCCTKNISYGGKNLKTHGYFTYFTELWGSEFPAGETLPREFRNLKIHIKDHLVTQLHMERANNDLGSLKLTSRNKNVGMCIGRTAYDCFKSGFSARTFEDLILLQARNGVDIGDLNHSKMFPVTFRKHVAAVVREKVDNFTNTVLEQTGHLPVMNIIADKATWKHRTRQFVMAVCMVPNAPQLIEPIYLGFPIVKAHTGYAVVKSIKDLLDGRRICGKQIVGASVDGQYIHLGIEEALSEIYGSEGSNIQVSWDPMHKAGLVDKHLFDEQAHSWVINVITICKDLYTEFNWGAAHERYLDAGKELQEQDEITTVTPLATTCETRFANSKRHIFLKTHKNLPTIIKSLQDIQIENMDGYSKEKQKANDAASLEGRILNAKTLLELSCLCDIYDVFGELINACQIVNLLPYERLEKVDYFISYMNDMISSCGDHEKCLTTRVRINKGDFCYWKVFHKEKKSFMEKKEINGIPILDIAPHRAGIGAHGTRTTSLTSCATDIILVEQITKNTFDFLTEMKNNLEEKVFHENDRNIIIKIKEITDLENVFRLVQEIGPVRASAKLIQKYLINLKLIVTDLIEIPDMVLSDQFANLCHSLASEVVINCIRDFEKSSKEQSISKKLIMILLDSKYELYRKCELVVHGITVASLKFNVESVVESLVSQYEYRFGPKRSAPEETADNEMEIYINGPNVNNCDAVVKAALDKHFGGALKWHFLVKNSIESYSKKTGTIARLLKEPSKLPFM